MSTSILSTTHHHSTHSQAPIPIRRYSTSAINIQTHHPSKMHGPIKVPPANPVNYADTLEIYIAFRHSENNNPRHWILMLDEPAADLSTWFHVVGGPTEDREYEIKIEADKPLVSSGWAHTEYLWFIHAGEVNTVKAMAESISLQYGQTWIVELLAKMEAKGFIPTGTKVCYQAQVEKVPE